MKQLTYYIDKGNGHFEPFYEYMIPNVGADEFYARQLCTYFIMKGTQYELVSNEMDGEQEILVIKEMGRNLSGEDEEQAVEACLKWYMPRLLAKCPRSMIRKKKIVYSVYFSFKISISLAYPSNSFGVSK